MASPLTLTNKTLGKFPALLSGQLRSIRRPTGFFCSMANTIRVGAVQMSSTNDLDANYSTCSRLVKEAAASGVKFLCFPESFSFVSLKTGDSLKVSEPIDGPIMQKYCSLARESSIWLSLGGFQEKGPDDAHLHNTHVLVDDAGNIRRTYRKIHLFDVDVPGNMVYKESSYTTAGNAIVVEDSPAGRLGLTVCYDLRFPELYQQLRFENNAQVLLVPSAFTMVTGAAHWEVLLRARAIETQCFVIAAAQAGKHNEKRESYGDSLIIDPWGTILARLPGVQLGRGANIYLGNAVINTEDVGATIQFGSLNFPAIIGATPEAPTYCALVRGHAGRPQVNEASTHHAHQPVQQPTVKEFSRQRTSTFKRLGQSEAPMMKRAIN